MNLNYSETTFASDTSYNTRELTTLQQENKNLLNDINLFEIVPTHNVDH